MNVFKKVVACIAHKRKTNHLDAVPQHNVHQDHLFEVRMDPAKVTRRFAGRLFF
jgi:hypothetical protein